ncbi:MAG: DUF3391 domain-containing protein [Rubrivivax sp.]|nr:DUF3391 domain-containing protein [Rubrivivax sp.]
MLRSAWIAPPFWQSRFVIDSAADLKRLHECAIAECWIDTRLGLDLVAVSEPMPTPAPVLAEPLPAAAPPAACSGWRTLRARCGAIPTRW